MSCMTPLHERFCRPERKRKGSPYRKRLSKPCTDFYGRVWPTATGYFFGVDRHVGLLMARGRFSVFKWYKGAFRCQLHNTRPFASVSFLWEIGMQPCTPPRERCSCPLPRVAEEMIIYYVSQRVCEEVR